MTREKKEPSSNELIEALLEKYGRSREAILGENGLLSDLKKRRTKKT